ncbi:MAG: enoyl-CoA hydratase [Nitrincola lacisaponensis]|uniref:enoyl-CoA hydratase n=1 Tax=Nitrincola lacisaponensis TaxID=267850 RepID=UPI00391A488F
MTDSLLLEKRGHIAILTMNNLPANTWTAESLQALIDIVEALNADPDIWSLVLTSASDKFFSAGADLKLFADGNREMAHAMAVLFGRAFEILSQFRGVSIAAINGWAMGGGLEVALACDLRVAEEQAKMALPEAKVGLLPCAGGTQNLTLLVGEGWAKRMILCGEQVDAQKAEKIGLIEEVVPRGEAFNRALALAEQACQQSPSSLKACKKLIQNNRHMPFAQGYILEREWFVDLFNTDDQREGVNAFLEKRKPEWKNR